MDIKPIKLSPKKGGNGYLSSYSINFGSAEIRALGFVDMEGNPLPIEKVIDYDRQTITIRLKTES